MLSVKYSSSNPNLLGDNLVAHSAKNQTWPTQQNVAVTLTYPTSGTGKQVTFVAIQVDQVSVNRIVTLNVGQCIYLGFCVSDIGLRSSIFDKRRLAST